MKPPKKLKFRTECCYSPKLLMLFIECAYFLTVLTVIFDIIWIRLMSWLLFLNTSFTVITLVCPFGPLLFLRKGPWKKMRCSLITNVSICANKGNFLLYRFIFYMLLNGFYGPYYIWTVIGPIKTSVLSGKLMRTRKTQNTFPIETPLVFWIIWFDKWIHHPFPIKK